LWIEQRAVNIGGQKTNGAELRALSLGPQQRTRGFYHFFIVTYAAGVAGSRMISDRCVSAGSPGTVLAFFLRGSMAESLRKWCTVVRVGSLRPLLEQSSAASISRKLLLSVVVIYCASHGSTLFLLHFVVEVGSDGSGDCALHSPPA
jgi:hypothetical protein